MALSASALGCIIRHVDGIRHLYSRWAVNRHQERSGCPSKYGRRIDTRRVPPTDMSPVSPGTCGTKLPTRLKRPDTYARTFWSGGYPTQCDIAEIYQNGLGTQSTSTQSQAQTTISSGRSCWSC
ncbi:hypothetical protein LX32DRAFT_114528 [Colletotrichum zoysiae]|uniref:Uncharacterized protein n=1 Tax=Colletotrichum zoysiae TaxID=1216348 RepID=A0AAD9LX69_9PEZI|nr:hypothetical protein LX32DRAFT_114528 [Colletotrichum zoysiae]